MSFHFHSRGLLSAGPSKKRKEPSTPAPPNKAGEPSVLSNRLLAGYMAYEFLTKGTLFGRKFDPTRDEATPSSAAVSQWKKPKFEAAPPEILKKEHQNQIQSYAEVANILKTTGSHISGIVNPTQLGRWLQK
ncbi:uncharacterized protein E5676_scaffold434G001830 [Cucumis melo var. makuwa]|uniref:Embryo sac development arrest 6 n=2 Tax=Cucumis melo TaxID=3656 RepID=A0A5A7U1L2_CUCMM|nr:uncharacterized protein E6C27_scaffold171G004700 [Cucumis melo var. makuwa]TYK17328.1 uncharacterized protein E5676_scaffold434G001830 [Cucumis melo var. makuwa]